MLILTEERLPEEDVRIAPESYRLREEITREHIDAIFRYANNQTECRSLVIQHYFGEQSSVPCGRCDICLEHRKHQNATQLSNTQKQIRTQLLERLSNNPLTVKQLADRMFVPIDTILKEITALIQEQKIIEDKGGKLQINR